MSRRDRRPDRATEPQAYTDYLRERIYATFTGLAIVLVVGNADHADPRHGFFALVLGVVGIVVAGLVSDVVAHLMMHQSLPSRTEARTLAAIAGGGLSTVVAPGILMLLALLEVMDVDAALRAAAIVYVATLGVIGWLAVRRSNLSGGLRLVVLGILVGLGFAVIGLQILAKSV